MPAVTLDCNDSGTCLIELAGNPIGTIEGTYSTIQDIRIDPEHRENGYGRTAVEQYLREAEERGVTHIETTAVIHSAMERIVQSLGFTRCSHDPSHFECELPGTLPDEPAH